MTKAAARHILGDPSGHLFQGHGTQILPGARAHGQLPGLDFPIACDQQVRDTLQRVLADFIAHLLVPQVDFGAKPLISKEFGGLGGEIRPAFR